MGIDAESGAEWSARCRVVLDEITADLAGVDPAAVGALADRLAAAERVFVAGAGRTGLAMRMLAMRLMQAGLVVYVAGETTAPACGPGDLVLIGSGSGRTATLQTLASRTEDAGARLALVTRAPESPLAEAAETVLVLPTPAAPARAGGLAGAQPLGTRFEQGLVILLDLVFAATLQRVGADNDALQRRHANLE